MIFYINIGGNSLHPLCCSETWNGPPRAPYLHNGASEERAWLGVVELVVLCVFGSL